MGVPETMRAVVLAGHGGIEMLRFEPAWPVPALGPHDVLVEVGACAVNATDVNTRVGWYAAGDDNGAWDEPIRFPRIQGADVCGRIAAIGATAGSAPAVGRRVMIDPWVRDPDRPDDLGRCRYLGSELDGGYAEYVAVPAANAHLVESPLSDAELASFATSYGTALNLVRRASVQPGDDVLVTGASGGVGAALVQLVRLAGARPIAVCHPDKADAVRDLGAAFTLDRDGDLRDGLRRAIGRTSVRRVIDVVGGPQWSRLLDVLDRGGTYAVAGAIAGPHVSLDLRTLYLNDLTFVGVAVMPPGLFADLVGLVERGEIRPVVAATFPFDAAAEAQEVFTRKQHIGKIVLRGWNRAAASSSEAWS